MIEATWRENEITGYGKLSYTKTVLPKVSDPKETGFSVLSYVGYLKNCRMHGEGTLVT